MAETNLNFDAKVAGAANPFPVVQTGTPVLPTGAAVSKADGTAFTAADPIDPIGAVLADPASLPTAGTAGNYSRLLADLSRQLLASAVLRAGSAVIGKVGIDQTAPGVTNAVSLAADAMSTAGVALVPKFARIDAASSGSNTIIGAVSSKKIRVLSCVLISAGSVTAKFQSGAAGTDLMGALPLSAQAGFSSGFCPVGLFETASNTLLNLQLSGAVQVSGFLTYVEV